MDHNRKLVIGGVALVKARVPIKAEMAALHHVRDEIEGELISSGYLSGAPFSWVSLMIRKGLVDGATPHYQAIDKKDGDLPLSIEVDARDLTGATQDRVVVSYKRATLRALIHAGEKYKLPTERLKALLFLIEDKPNHGFKPN